MRLRPAASQTRSGWVDGEALIQMFRVFKVYKKMLEFRGQILQNDTNSLKTFKDLARPNEFLPHILGQM